MSPPHLKIFDVNHDDNDDDDDEPNVKDRKNDDGGNAAAVTDAATTDDDTLYKEDKLPLVHQRRNSGSRRSLTSQKYARIRI